MSLLSNMRGPRLKTPLLLLLLLLLSSLTEKAFSQDEGEEDITEPTQELEEPETEPAPTTPEENPDSDTTQTPHISAFSQTDAVLVEEDTGSGSGEVDSMNSTDPEPEEKDLDLLTILIPAIVAVVLIVAIICGAVIIKRQCNKNSTIHEDKEDPYLDECSTEKVPMPMFEEDVPSVLELEMDELDKWMQKDF